MQSQKEVLSDLNSSALNPKVLERVARRINAELEYLHEEGEVIFTSKFQAVLVMLLSELEAAQ